MTHNTSFSNRTDTSSRRSVLTSIATVGAIGVAGCLGDDEDAPTEPDQGPFSDIRIEGLDIVIELDRDSIDVVNVIDPTGSLFTQQRIETGVTRETIRLGTSYVPGVYEFVALVDDESIGSTERRIEPDLEIVDFKLGRDYPEEMWDGAGPNAIRTEAIVTVKNTGTGPTGITQLRFDGDVPRPTPEDYPTSGIYDTDRGLGEVDVLHIHSGSEESLQSRTSPFSSVSGVVECSPETTEGIIVCHISTVHTEVTGSKIFVAQYTGESLSDCEVTVEEQIP